MSQFTVSDVNPNEVVGGGGCLGHGDQKSEDCIGPYVIFETVETSSNLSPHAVLCSRCLQNVVETLGGDTPDVIELPESEVTEVPSNRGTVCYPDDATIPVI